MIWDQFFLTRAALVLFSMIAAMFWLIVGFVDTMGRMPDHPIWILLLLHALGTIGICAGFFGQRKLALCVTLIVGLMWFAVMGVLVPAILKIARLGPFSDLGRSWAWGLVSFGMLAGSGFALFFITWLLVRNSRQVPDHYRDF